MPAGVEGVAAGDAAEAAPGSVEGAVFLDGGDEIRAAGGLEAAVGA